MSLRGHIPASIDRHMSGSLEGRSVQSPGLLRHGPFPGSAPPLHHRHQTEPSLPPPHLELLERKLSFQLNEMEKLGRENTRLADSHIAMRQEIAASQKEIDAIQAHLAGVRSQIDIQIMGVFEKIKNYETEIRIGETLQVDLHQAHVEAQALTAAREELGNEMRQLGEELERCGAENRKLHEMYKELDGLRQEHQTLRSTFENEKGTNVKQVERMQGMEKNLMSMAKEVEKLRADIANAENRMQQATGNQTAQYQNPVSMYHQPAPTYQQPAPTYQQPAPTYQQTAPTYQQTAPTYQQPIVQAGAYGNQGCGQGVTYPQNPVYSYPVPQYGQPGPAVYQNPYVTTQNPAAGVMTTDGATYPNHYASPTVPGYTVPAPYGGNMVSYDPSCGTGASAAGNQA